MPLNLTKADLRLLSALHNGKPAKDAGDNSDERLKALHDQFGTRTQDELLAAFRSVTGWANDPKDYA